jgi:hypothetical protein
MQTKEEQEYQSFEEDVALLVNALKDSFESTEANARIDDLNNSLYVYLEGLNEYEDQEIDEIASPLLEELDLDFEHIYLLPLETS